MKNKLKSDDISKYKLTYSELEEVVIAQRRIIESQAKELKKLKAPRRLQSWPNDEIPQTD